MPHASQGSTADPHFSLSYDGDVQFMDARVARPISFAHVADLHLPPHPPDAWPPEYRQAIDRWDTEFGHPHQVLPGLLDDVCARGVDFIFFGGDILDVYHSETARLVVEQCRRRNVPACFQIGNHDWQDEHIRYVTHEWDAEVRAAQCEKLSGDWNMPGLHYSFEREGVRFIALDIPYVKRDGRYEGVFDTAQTDWFINRLDYDGPIIVFCHVPFNCPTFAYRLRAVWRDAWGCIAEDENGLRIRSAIGGCPNVLGTFTAHTHFRSEDPLGHTCQFMAPPGHNGRWRYVKITSPLAG